MLPAATRFLAYLHEERGLSPRTRAAYGRDLQCFSAELAAHGISDPNRVGEHEIRRFIARLHRQGLGARSIQRLLSATRSFYRWLMREGLADHNPAAAVRAPRTGRKLPGTLDTDAVARLLDIRDDSPLAVRDKAMLELFYSSGLRLAELAGEEAVLVSESGIKTYADVKRVAAAGVRAVLVGQALMETGDIARGVVIQASGAEDDLCGVLLICIGFGLAVQNWLSLAIAVVPSVAALLYRIRVEERELVSSLGSAYVQYQKRTRRLIPWIW